MYCRNCGAPLEDGARFCTGCGKRLETAAPTKKHCPFCGAEQAAASAFCSRCGKPLGTSATAAPHTTSARYAQYGAPQSAASGEYRPRSAAHAKKSGSKTALIVLLIVLIVVVVGFAAVRGVQAYRDRREPAQRERAGETAGAIPTPAAETQPTTEPREEATPAPTAEVTPRPTPEPLPERPPDEAPFYEPDAFSTSETPTLADFQWVTNDIYNGMLPDDLELLTDFEELRGGWKCYLIDEAAYDTMMERLLNVFIGGTPEETDVTFDWFYAHNNALDEGYDEDDPPTVFSGSWEDGEISALGPGRVTLTDFWFDEGYEYGIGTFMWPDGVVATVLLARP